MHDGRAAVARHPDAFSLHTAVEITAATMLLQESVERGEQVRHRGRE